MPPARPAPSSPPDASVHPVGRAEAAFGVRAPRARQPRRAQTVTAAVTGDGTAGWRPRSRSLGRWRGLEDAEQGLHAGCREGRSVAEAEDKHGGGDEDGDERLDGQVGADAGRLGVVQRRRGRLLGGKDGRFGRMGTACWGWPGPASQPVW
jgi:hypothetical protein